MSHYSWTVRAKDRKQIGRITTIDELREVLRILDLPGQAPPEITAIDGEVPEHGFYSHNEGGPDEWSLEWTKVDVAPANDG